MVGFDREVRVCFFVVTGAVTRVIAGVTRLIRACPGGTSLF